MEQNKVKILVACHKPDTVYSDDVYVPVHVGRALSKNTSEMSHMIGDDTGDNISPKNPFYCELTAQYWAWKNLKAEYVGLCHYRRYFREKITAQNIDRIMENADFLLASHVTFETSVCRWLTNALIEEDIYIFAHYFKKLYPDFSDTFDSYFYQGNVINPCNMFVCRKELFDKFAEWQFNFLFKLEKVIKFSEYTRLKRIMGYYGENMLRLYCLIHHLKIKELPIVSMVGDKKPIFKHSYLREFRTGLKFKWNNRHGMKWNEAVITGLRIDEVLNKDIH